MNIKKIATKITTLVCITGVVLVGNAPAVSAYEAHVINVTATIIDNGVSISPDGGNFCNDGKLKIELTPRTEGAKVFYTTNGSEPKCGSGESYSEPFTLSGSVTVKAVACYNGKQGPTTSKLFGVSPDYCQTSLKINKVYFYADVNHGGTSNDTDNEWFEIYNPTKEDVNIKDWSVCNSESCDKLASQDLAIPAKGYAVATYKESTWSYWNIPNSVVKINLSSVIGSGLGNTADMLTIRNGAGELIDQMNWGVANSRWTNYNANVWGQGVSASANGKILGRITNGYDTDSAADWKIFDLPNVGVKYPNGEETWIIGKTYTVLWTALNPNGYANDLGIDIYFSADSGKTWVAVVKNTANDGAYEWRLPLNITENGSNYFTVSNKARIKVVATDYARNFMFTGRDISDRDFCPPIDKSLLTAEELKLLSEIDTTGMLIVDSKTAAAMEASGATQPSSDNTKDSVEIKSSTMLNKEEDEFSIDGQAESDTSAKDKKETDKQVLSDSKVKEAQPTVETISMKTDLVVAGGSDQKAVSAVDDMPIMPDTDMTIEFNLNA